MVAAHLGNLSGERMRDETIFVEEESPEVIKSAKEEGRVDIWIGLDWIGLEDGKEGERGLVELARRIEDLTDDN